MRLLDQQSGIADDSGGASRFFYCAKASKSDRNAGLAEVNPQAHETFQGGNKLGRKPHDTTQPQANNHPTVKSTKLMEYLIKLITPPNGKVLDPFMGSGSTGVAATRLGFEFVGIEQEQSYFEIAKRRLEHAVRL